MLKARLAVRPSPPMELATSLICTLFLPQPTKLHERFDVILERMAVQVQALQVVHLIPAGSSSATAARSC